MNIIDGVVNFFSPKAGAERMAYRHAMDEIRSSYDAGNDQRINSNWRVRNESAEFTDRWDRDIVRARARDLERNSDMLGAVVSAWKRNVIGGGRTLQANTGDDKLNSQLEELWTEWCKKKNCDVTNTQSLTQMLRMAVERKKVDGGILFLKCYTNNGIVPFQLQAIEVDELDINVYQPHKNQKNKVVGGIEYNSYNRAVGYFIKRYSLDGMELLSNPVFVDAKNVIFYFSKKRPSQIREMSEMSNILTRIRDANEFMNAVSVKERIMACLAVFIKKQTPINAGIGRTTTVGNGEKKQTYQGKTISPGMIKELNAGDEVQVVNPSGQSGDATNFIKLQQRLVGSGQGLSYEVTSRDMSETTYSSARQGMIEDGETFVEDEELIVEVMDEIYETFFISCILAEKIKIKDFWDNKLKYFRHTWVKSPKPWIDPYKEANANKIALETGQKTFVDIAAERGKDWKKSVDDIAEVAKYAESLGVTLGGVLKNDKNEENNKSEEQTD